MDMRQKCQTKEGQMIKFNHPPKYCLLLGIISLIAFSMPSIAPAQINQEVVLFASVNPSQWIVNGRVTMLPSDTTMRMIFGFDEDHPPVFPPDTTEVEIATELNLTGYYEARILYETLDLLPHTDSWVDGNIRFFIRHEYQTYWTEVTDNLSSLAGWASHLQFKMKVAVRSSAQYPGAFVLDNFRIVARPR